ncbi:MAG TPA: choice-of-anchor O protein, partial [Pseudomonadales bacterium]
MKPLQKTPVAAAIAASLAMLLTACGNNDHDTGLLPAKVGTFVDSPVDGLDYKGIRSGKTSGGGHYYFQPGSSVAFYIGRIRLGSLQGTEETVSPRDFFADAHLSDYINNQNLLNILVLLQSLDDDGDTSGGITITEDAVAALEAALIDAGYNPATLDLSAMTEAEAIAFQADLPAILAATVAATDSADDVVVEEDAAIEHYLASSGDISLHKNISRTPSKGSAGHSITPMTVITDYTTATGEVDASQKVHPILVGFTDVVSGDFQMGTGSAELPDIDHVSDVFVAVSLDNGSTFKTTNISNTADKSSIQVDYYGDGQLLDYYGNSYKPAVKAQGNKVLVAWNDKYCASGNPLGLVNTGTQGAPEYLDDLYQVNGPQGLIDYEGTAEYGEEVLPVHEVPFSCVMTARGVYDETQHKMIWHAPMQLTTGRRDSNKIAIASSDQGFVVTWQEDPDGLRPGKGAGPGEGWSGASTNHGADVWYSYIAMADFEATDGDDPEDPTKPKSLNNLSYPVRISDNAVCRQDNVDSGKAALYCVDLCTNNGFFNDVDDPENKDNGKCYSSYNDPITEVYNAEDPAFVVEQQLLNGDTGASRPVIGLFGSTVILGYEETKGLANNLPGVPNTDSTDVTPEQQGKIAYVHSFPMTVPDTVAPGTIVNPLRPNELDGTPVLENVRRLTLVTQVDVNEVEPGVDYLWGILYKSGIETQGGSSDMYLRLAKDYTTESLLADTEIRNLSARTADTDETVIGSWSPANLDDATWENQFENTFSPRGFLRGSSIFIAYEYTPSWRVAQVGHLSNNFNIIRSFDNGASWQAPI